MRWNLDRFYKSEMSEQMWHKDLQVLSDLYKSADFDKAEELESYLWTYAYAKVSIDDNRSYWENNIFVLENTLKDFYEEDDMDFKSCQIQDKVNQILSPLKNHDFGGLTSFQAATSTDSKIRNQYFNYANKFYETNKNQLSTLLLKWIEIQKKEEIPSYYFKVRDKLVSKISYFHELLEKQVSMKSEGKLSWVDLNFNEESKLHEMNYDIGKNNIIHLMKDLNPEWSETIQYLFDSGCVEASCKKTKEKKAFTMPVSYNKDPLCFIHSVTNRASFFGLTHELAHGLHFYKYKETNRNYILPDTSVLEIFPTSVDLYTSYRLEGQSGFSQRVISTVLFQFAITEFIFKLIDNAPDHPDYIQEIWMDVCKFTFGDYLEENNYLWCGNRLVWSHINEGMCYVFGGVLALELFEILKNGSVSSMERINSVLSLPAGADIEDWNKILSFVKWD
ncbi:hypothetical protein [Chengkuizengella axinellae]|uniref:Peptidase M3A/M3B catalytic domain-containing protein n=1 Tax=Chengkuizengella axinellae TaxID=3064388 RepID=A0ABT9IZN6_9BACL|nr:hypothetical protein [Chengkuizengella sp. 2205SS18-9]MDP5274840.1 hypothetical protein [Chengkuizengella sp. 2205SS18-9]